VTAILGLNLNHADSSACLLLDGKLVGAIAEERLGKRMKHTSSFPKQAIKWLLIENNVRLRDITHVAIARNPKANKVAKLKYALSHPFVGIPAYKEYILRKKKTNNIFDVLTTICEEKASNVRFELVEVEHHLAHIASSYYCSPFESLTAGFSYDASGDFASAMIASCEGKTINVIDRVTLPDSLGFFYTALCQFIGFDKFGEEYKVMGLAGYGEDAFRKEMEQLLKLKENAWYSLNQAYFGMHSGGESGSLDNNDEIILNKLYRDPLENILGPSAKRGIITEREKNIACSTQVRFEEAVTHSLNKVYKIVETKRLVTAGGCALNGIANTRIFRETPFEYSFIQPAASDDGTCIGAAFWTWHNILNKTERFFMTNAFWGPGYGDHTIEKALKLKNLKFVKCKNNEELVNSVSSFIADGKVVGWYQGRSEWGPRALGNRSILANPAIKNMKDIINQKIKRRENFRPFAPSVLKKDVSTYFEMEIESPFMMHVTKLKTKWRSLLPAITHIDGTARLQTVDIENNALYFELISAFKKKTGIGMLLNTSFNENEPIVDTPGQAVDCFIRTDMDVLAIGRYLVQKIKGDN
jgi:carbamoyltransferase